MAEQGPPRIDADRLDFSQFHPLDHFLGSRRCRSMYGSWRNHLSMEWEYRWRPWLTSQTLCRIGRHSIANAWRRSTPDDEWTSWRVCRNCAYRPED